MEYTSFFSNYRPISVLPVLFKVLEKLVHTRISKHLSDSNILYNHQYGFREKKCLWLFYRSTVVKITTDLDDEKYFLGIFLDVPKVFDTVNFKILLIKFNNIGILFLNGFIVTFLKENSMSLLITRIPIDLNLYVGFPKVPFWTLSYF